MGVCPRFFIEVGSSGKKIHCAVHNAYACLTNWACAFTMQQRLTQAVNLFRQPVAKPWSCFILQSGAPLNRSEEHTSELQSLMRISYAVFCLKKKTHKNTQQ